MKNKLLAFMSCTKLEHIVNSIAYLLPVFCTKLTIDCVKYSVGYEKILTFV